MTHEFPVKGHEKPGVHYPITLIFSNSRLFMKTLPFAQSQGKLSYLAGVEKAA
jgi:hypothetical protein